MRPLPPLNQAQVRALVIAPCILILGLVVPGSLEPAPAIAASPFGETPFNQMASYSIALSEREAQTRNYERAAGHKAIAVAPKARHTSLTGGWLTRAAAEIGALEACQLTYQEPCALIAVDEKVEPATGGLPTLRDMPRTRYAGPFDLEKIPRARPDLLRRADVRNYASARGPKAAAFHIHGTLFVVTRAASQIKAEEQALAQCNNDPVRNGADGMCFLYAAGNRVVLPQRFQTAQSDGPSGITVSPAKIIEHLSFDTNPASGVKPARILAALYLPSAANPVPAMVIISSSGGVIDWIEGYYARELARNGVAALVVDSFGPREVKNVIQDQSLVTSWDMENDAFAALALLQKDPRVDPTRIGVMGVSKGGLVAHHSIMLIRQSWRKTGDRAFAAHIAIVPDCAAQHHNVRTTGKPILFMLAELDDATLAEPCREYAERLRAAGNPNVTVKLYRGAHHNWEDTRPLSYIAQAQNSSKCFALIEDNGDWVAADTKEVVKDPSAWVNRGSCRSSGFHVGGGSDQLKRQATFDIVEFLKRNGF